MVLRRESSWMSPTADLAYRLGNLRIALALLAEHVAGTRAEIARVMADPFSAEQTRSWIIFAARWTGWALRNLAMNIECAELEALAACRRNLVVSARGIARILDIGPGDLDPDDLRC
jgi:hypothetical protein